jgi:hypothetical protein
VGVVKGDLLTIQGDVFQSIPEHMQRPFVRGVGCQYAETGFLVAVQHARTAALCGVHLQAPPSPPLAVHLNFGGLHGQICVAFSRHSQIIGIAMGFDLVVEIAEILFNAVWAAASPASMEPSEQGLHEDEKKKRGEAVSLERSSVDVNFCGSHPGSTKLVLAPE